MGRKRLYDYETARMDLLAVVDNLLDCKGESPTYTELAMTMNLGKSSVIQQLNWLTENGYIERSGRSRGMVLGITEKGRSALESGVFAEDLAADQSGTVQEPVPKDKPDQRNPITITEKGKEALIESTRVTITEEGKAALVALAIGTMKEAVVEADGVIRLDGAVYEAEFLKLMPGAEVLIEKAENMLFVSRMDTKVLGCARLQPEPAKEDEALLGLFRKLENVETKDLVKELARREGASLIRTREGQQFKITGDSSRIKEIGKATILLIRGA